MSLRIAFSARGADGEESAVDVVILLAGPGAANRTLLRVLARLVRAVRGGDLAGRLRRATTRQEMAAVLSGIDTELT